MTLRGARIRKVTGVTALGTGAKLDYTTRATIVDTMLNPDPHGELRIAVPPSAIDEDATVIAVDFAPGTLA